MSVTAFTRSIGYVGLFIWNGKRVCWGVGMHFFIIRNCFSDWFVVISRRNRVGSFILVCSFLTLNFFLFLLLSLLGLLSFFVFLRLHHLGKLFVGKRHDVRN